MRRLLIAGAGHACITCIEQLLKFKQQFRITVLEAPVHRQDGRQDGRHVGSEDGSGSTPGQAKIDPLQREWLRKNDVEVRTTICVEAIDRHANVVRGCDGSRTTFDTLILAAGGSIPALARAAGLEVRSGVVVNDFMEASDAHVYALGEGAEHRGSIYSDAETVVEQARVLAAHLFGHSTAPFVPAIPRKTALTDLIPSLLNADSALKTSAASPDASADSGQRWEDQTPEPASLPALAGVA